MNEEIEKVIYPEIEIALLEMGRKDQEALQKGQAPQVFEELTRINSERMKAIVDQIGWPTISKVGKEGSRNAWLLVQHSDHDREFQRRILEMMKKEPAGEVKPSNIAYLEDRVLVAAGKNQRYGTQLDWLEEGVVVTIKPVEDPENLNKRRAEVGLNPIEEYLGDAARLRGIKYKLPSLDSDSGSTSET